MDKEKVILAWKNPAVRSALSVSAAHPAGDALAGLNEEELAAVYGGGDVQAESTPTIVPMVNGLIEAAITSSGFCAGAGAGVAAGATVVLSIRHCGG